MDYILESGGSIAHDYYNLVDSPSHIVEHQGHCACLAM